MKIAMKAKCGACGADMPSEVDLEAGGHVVCLKCNQVVLESKKRSRRLVQ